MGILDRLTKQGKKVSTLKSVKKHGTAKRSTISTVVKQTLGSGVDLILAVRLPSDEDINDWYAANTVDFFNEISLLYGLCIEDAKRFKAPGKGFPTGYEYMWKKSPTDPPMQVSSPEYVDYVMTWIEDQIDNEEIFPTMESSPFPDDFRETYLVHMYGRMFRIFAIIYHRHMEALESLEAAKHLNTVFKHFMYFAFEFELVPEKEFRVLERPVAHLREQYLKAKEKI